MTSTADEKDAIRELMAHYCHALDACKFSEVASACGRAQIETLLASVVPKPGEGPQRKHYITNIIVTLADDDRASARSDYLVIRESTGGLIPVMGGTYLDTFVKREGGWQFARKELVHNIAGDMALKPPDLADADPFGIYSKGPGPAPSRRPTQEREHGRLSEGQPKLRDRSLSRLSAAEFDPKRPSRGFACALDS